MTPKQLEDEHRERVARAYRQIADGYKDLAALAEVAPAPPLPRPGEYRGYRFMPGNGDAVMIYWGAHLAHTVESDRAAREWVDALFGTLPARPVALFPAKVREASEMYRGFMLAPAAGGHCVVRGEGHRIVHRADSFGAARDWVAGQVPAMELDDAA